MSAREDSPLRVSVEEAAQNLRALLKQVAAGEEVVLVDQDTVVARLLPPIDREHWLAHRRNFRAGIQVQGKPLSTTIIEARQEERY